MKVTEVGQDELRRRALPLCGRFENLGWVADGDQLTIAILNVDSTKSPRFTITLCPRKVSACLRSLYASARCRSSIASTPGPSSATARPATANTAAPTAAPALSDSAFGPPIDQRILRAFGLRVPAGTHQVWIVS